MTGPSPHGRAIVGLLLLSLPSSGAEDRPPPSILGIDPPGATIGRGESWTFTGLNLTSVDRVIVSGSGVDVLAIEHEGETVLRARVRVERDALPGFREVRLDGPGGISNLLMVRVDTLGQVAKSPKAGTVEDAQVIAEGSAVVGRLLPREVDLYRVRGTPGRRLTLDLEARRLGLPMAPVLTILGDSGVATAQGREPRGGDRDVRMGVVVPPSGSFLVQVRDNTYVGGEHARYRLRVDPSPFATAIFPLGGSRGSLVAVEVSGGNLDGPLRKEVRLPDRAGETIEVGLVDGSILGPGRLVAGDGPEVAESSTTLQIGSTVNGRLGRPGEVDSYRVKVRAGERVESRVEAASLGSWLDSVVVVRDDRGFAVAENDDPAGRKTTDSLVDYFAPADGVLTVEVFDRFGGGGPEFGYRLRVGPPRVDFAITLLPDRSTGGEAGRWNLGAGSSIKIPFRIDPEGRVGKVEVRVEGLPPGVRADPVVVRVGESPLTDFLTLKVARDAKASLCFLRVVASGSVVREASAEVPIGLGLSPRPPIVRSVDRFPLRVLGRIEPGGVRD